jgi:hypothetical protein
VRGDILIEIDGPNAPPRTPRDARILHPPPAHPKRSTRHIPPRGTVRTIPQCGVGKPNTTWVATTRSSTRASGHYAEPRRPVRGSGAP